LAAVLRRALQHSPDIKKAVNRRSAGADCGDRLESDILADWEALENNPRQKSLADWSFHDQWAETALAIAWQTKKRHRFNTGAV
jgi:hypothetical protein